MTRARRFATAVALAVALAAPAAAEPRAPVEVSVLTYNIHGLPSWIARDDPPARIPLLLEKAAAYDLVLVQEDFAHQAAVDAGRRHRFLWRGNGAWLAGLGQGAGLTVLSRFGAAAPDASAAYGVCSGWLWPGSASDCFGNKGWQQVPLVLPNGARMDVWNTHLDAGGGERDRAAREAQLALLATAVESRSAGRALVVGGDLNLEWDDPADRALLDRFVARLGLEIAARAPFADGDHRVDYLLVRSGREVRVEPLEGGADPRFVDGDEAPLSDHPALFARLRVR